MKNPTTFDLRPLRSSSPAPALVLAGFALLSVGCSSSPGIGSDPLDFRQARLEREIRSRGLDPESLVRPYELNEEMRQWVREVVPPTGEPKDRLKILLNALLDPGALEVQYRSGYTGTAEEAFQERAANCLAFTHLFVGLAREVGLDAYFLDVLNAETFDRTKDLTVRSDHVTAGHGLVTDPLILKYNVGPEASYGRLQKIEDLQAVAMFYSNRGAEVLQTHGPEEALEWLRTALTLDPGLAPAWVNYGVVLRRLGEAQAAEEAYRKALELDPRELTAYHNLASLMRREGRPEEARHLEELGRRRGDRNPFNFLHLGDLSFRQGRLEEAERLYRKAMNLDRDLPEPYAALGVLSHYQAQEAAARRWLEKAKKRDAGHGRVQRLERLLDPEGQPATFVRLETAGEKTSS